MKKFAKIVGWIFIILLVIIIAGVSYIKLALPNVGANTYEN